MIAIAITSGIIRGNSGGGSKPEVTFPAAASAVPGQPGGVYIETEEETEASPFYQAMVEAIARSGKHVMNSGIRAVS